MTKYKHKITGIIGELLEDGHLHFERCGSKSCCHETIWKGFIENSNDWEEIEEKDYEILSFKSNRTNQIDDFQTNHAFLDEECYLKNEFWDIYSIRRKSDNEIFTIGDKIQYIDKSILFEEGCPIERFEIHNNKIYVNGHVASSDDFNREISNWEHFKKPLFISEDGKEILNKRDIVFGVFINNDTVYQHKYYTVEQNTFNYFHNYGLKYWKIFSNKKNAEEYILMNKPCLSINDILKSTVIGSCAFKDFKNLVKQKL